MFSGAFWFISPPLGLNLESCYVRSPNLMTRDFSIIFFVAYQKMGIKVLFIFLSSDNTICRMIMAIYTIA